MSCKTIAQDIGAAITASSVALTDRFVFTQNGTAYGVSFSGMIASMGATGTITSLGTSPTATPILNVISEGDNKIRTVEGSKGVITAVDAYGGVSIKTNFANSGGGASLIKDTTAAQIGFRGLTAGDGITIDQRANDILISTTTATVSSKTVIVTTVDDFPTALAGVITLANDTDYFLANDLSTSNRFIVGSKTTLRGPASQIVTLTYTGVGIMLTGTAPNMRIDRVTLNCPSGQVFDISSSGTGIFQMIESNVLECDTVGTIGTMFLVRFKGLALQSIVTNGITFTGNIDIFVSDTIVAFPAAGILYDLGTAVFNSINITNQYIKSTTAVTFISGAAASANVAALGFATVSNCRTPASVTPLGGVSEGDVRWNFLANNNIADTRPDALLSFSTPTTTVITTISTPVLVTGTWVVDRNSQMTGTAAGRVTYNGERSAVLPITATLSLEPVTGTNRDLAIYFYKNGSQVAASKVTATISAGSPKNQTVAWQDSFATGDYYELFVENNTGTTSLQVNSAIIRVN